MSLFPDPRGVRRWVTALAVTGAIASQAVPAAAASLEQVSAFGENPSNIKMYLYVPAKLSSATPPVLVGVHWCHGDAQAFYSGTGFAGLADKYGFIVIYPSAASSDGCWDVHSTASLTHHGGSDSRGIVSMVQYVLQNRHGDPARVYVTGHSSGGMMTEVLIGAYPEVVRAGAAFAGVPFSCLAGQDAWNTACATGTISKTGPQWGDAVRAAYPGYTGARPRMQLFHGTADDTLAFANFEQEIKQWTNVLGVSETPSTTETNTPKSPYTRTRYQDANQIVRVEAIKEQGQPHNLEIMAAEAVHFFGLDGTSDPVPIGGAGGSSGAGGGSGDGAGGAGAGGVGGAGGSGGAPAAGGADAGSSAGSSSLAGAGSGGLGGTTPGSAGTWAGGAPTGGVGGAPSSSGGRTNPSQNDDSTASDSNASCGCRVSPSAVPRNVWLGLLALCGAILQRRKLRLRNASPSRLSPNGSSASVSLHS
jgi:acetylxylan esterase